MGNISKRAISAQFVKDLNDGKLSHVLEVIKKDSTLDLEMRGKKIIVYYQGLKLLSIDGKQDVYEFVAMDNNYCKRMDGTTVEIPILSSDNIEEYIMKAKNVIDTYGIKYHFESEIKQLIVRENNISPIANGTDFYVIDTEYNVGRNKQFDIVALHIKSDSIERKKGNASIAIIEIKAGNNSLKTSRKNPGIKKHMEDFVTFVENDEQKKKFIADMKEIVSQKYELGLLKGLNLNTIKRLKIRDDIEFYVVLCNYKKVSKQLDRELNDIPNECKCKFFTSSFMGYGLYDDSIKTKEEILQILNDSCEKNLKL